MSPPPVAFPATNPTVLAALRSPRLLLVEILGGLVTAFALIPESLSFAIVAGLDPKLGLYAAFTMACVTAVCGGRPAMISGAAGSIALVIFPVARDHGVGFLFATVILGGLFQVILGALGVAKLMRFIPRSVMVGFVNALAILIFTAQLDNLIAVPWQVYPLVIAGLLIIIVFPKITTRVPAPLASILLITLAVVVSALDVPTVGDQGNLPDSLPTPGLPDIPWSIDSLIIVAPYALALALVGLMESLLTAKLVDELTDTHSNKTRESIGQGIANIVTGFLGGMGGCAMIGQTMVNVKQAGARTRISSLMAGVFLIVLSVSLSDLVGKIPMAALTSVMVIVAVTTFNWSSLRTLKIMPWSETCVMLVTVVATVATDNLAIGVILGVLTAMIAFTRRVAHVTRVDSMGPGKYRVRGQLFFASSNDLVNQFNYVDDPTQVTIDFSGATVWDSSTVAALEGIRERYARRGKTVEFTGLDEVSQRFIDRLAGQLD